MEQQEHVGLADALREVVQRGHRGGFWYDFHGAKISNQINSHFHLCHSVQFIKSNFIITNFLSEGRRLANN
jgi:hypothetical protein